MNDLEKWSIQKGLSYPIVKLCVFCLQEGNEDCLETMKDSLQGDLFDKYLRMAVGEYDIDDWTYKLRKDVPVNTIPKVNETALFKQFFNKLSKKGLVAKGNPDNPCPYTVIKKSKIVEDNFYNLLHEIDDLDIDKLVNIVYNYYTESNEYRTSLEKYLGEAAYSDYINYKEKKIMYAGLR